MMPASHHIVSGASAAAPSVLDVMRGAAAQRRRGAARVCLFGAPEPGSTRVLYDQMLEQQRQHMLQRYEFDVKTDRFVGDAAVAVQPAGGAVADGASEPIVDQLQQRLQAEDSSELAAAASPSPPSSPTESDDEDNTTDAAAAAAVGSGKVKSTKSTASLRPTKPYDKPAVRPITGKQTRQRTHLESFLLHRFSLCAIQLENTPLCSTCIVCGRSEPVQVYANKMR